MYRRFHQPQASERGPILGEQHQLITSSHAPAVHELKYSWEGSTVSTPHFSESHFLPLKLSTKAAQGQYAYLSLLLSLVTKNYFYF